MKYAGCYHGHADHLLVSAGSGLATFGKPSSAGVPAAFVECTRVLPLDDEKALQELFAREGARIAAVIIEPTPANHGLLLQRPEYLQALREITQQARRAADFRRSDLRLSRGARRRRAVDAASRRISPRSARSSAAACRSAALVDAREIMSRLAPEGDTYQAGTLSGNPVAMSAGVAALDVLVRESAWQKLETLGATLERMLAAGARESAVSGAFRACRLAVLAGLARRPGAACRHHAE